MLIKILPEAGGSSEASPLHFFREPGSPLGMVLMGSASTQQIGSVCGDCTDHDGRGQILANLEGWDGGMLLVSFCLVSLFRSSSNSACAAGELIWE